MAAYTERNVQTIAARVFTDLRAEINRAVANSFVPASFLAALISVECHRTKDGAFDPTRSRFERGVYADLISLRDIGYCMVNGKRRSDYSGVKRAQIADAGDTAIRALSSSYGYTQIMGYHSINNLHNPDGSAITIAQLRDSTLHLGYAVELLELTAAKHLRIQEYSDILRIWNTGSSKGKTHDPAYVQNALAVMDKYEALERGAEPIIEEAAVTREEFDALIERVAVLEEQHATC